MRRIKHFIAAALLVVASQASWAGFDEGLAAAQRGDFATALKEWRPLAAQGDAKAQNNLGFMYANGQGVPKDDVEAVKWFRLAAEQGHAKAQTNLGIMYDTGEGVPEDDVEAVKWYRLAAEQGHAPAQTNLGVMYFKGNGVPKDDVEAYAWLNLAAAQGLEDAARNRGIARKRMTQQQIAQAQARSKELGSGTPIKWQPSEP